MTLFLDSFIGKKYNYLKWFIILLPSILFFYLLSKYNFNSPMLDDIEAYNGFIAELYFTKLHFTQQFLLFFKNSSDHPVFFSRLFVWIYYLIFGEINYYYIKIIGNLHLMFLLWVSYSIFKTYKINSWNLLPVSLFLFSVQNNSSNFVTITLFQNSVNLSLVYIAVYLLLKENKLYNFIGLLMSIGINYSMSNGLFIWFSICILFLINKNKFKLFLFSALTLFFILLFLINRDIPIKTLNELDSLTLIKNIITGIVNFLGAFFDFTNRPSTSVQKRSFLPTIFGLLSLFCFSYISKSIVQLRKNTYFGDEKKLLALYGTILYIVFTSFLIGVTRSILDPFIVFSKSSHYRSYSGIYLALLYVCFMVILNKNRININKSLFILITLVLVFIFSVSMFFYKRNIEHLYYRSQSEVYNQVNNNVGLVGGTLDKLGKYINRTMDTCVKYKIYTYPKCPDLEMIEKLCFVNSKSNNITSLITNKVNNVLFLRYTPFSNEFPTFWFFRGKNKKWFFNTPSYLFTKEVSLTIDSSYLSHEKYELFLAQKIDADEFKILRVQNSNVANLNSSILLKKQ